MPPASRELQRLLTNTGTSLHRPPWKCRPHVRTRVTLLSITAESTPRSLSVLERTSRPPCGPTRACTPGPTSTPRPQPETERGWATSAAPHSRTFPKGHPAGTCDTHLLTGPHRGWSQQVHLSRSSYLFPSRSVQQAFIYRELSVSKAWGASGPQPAPEGVPAPEGHAIAPAGPRTLLPPRPLSRHAGDRLGAGISPPERRGAGRPVRSRSR